MPPNLNWRLVRRHGIAAIFVPFGTFIAFGVVVAVTGTGRVENIEEIGSVFAGSSLVLVFAHLAAQDQAGARRNVSTLAGLVVGVLAVTSVAGGGWRQPGLWAGGMAVLVALLAAAGLLGIRWARRYDRWRTARRSENRSDQGDHGDPAAEG